MAEFNRVAVIRTMLPFDAIRRRLKSRLLKRGSTPDDAEDLIQEAFLRFEQYAAQNEVREPEGFLTRTVVNLSIDADRSRRRSRISAVADEDMAHFADQSPGPAEVLYAGNRLRKLSEGIGTLHPRTRRILLAHRLEGRTYAEIAQDEGITVSSVEKQIAKAILLLTKWMGDD